MRRAGMAIPLVLVVLVVAMPIAAALFLRSSQTSGWIGKLQARDAATALAEEGEHAALERLRSGAGAGVGDRPTTDGGMSFAVFDSAPGAAGQVQYLIAAEGLHLGEERLLVLMAEVTGGPTATVVIPRDRAWQPADPAPLNPTALATAHQQRLDRYLTRLAAEQALTTPELQARIGGSIVALDPAFASFAAPLAAALSDAKVPAPPPPTPPVSLADLAAVYATAYAEYRALLDAGQTGPAADKHREFLNALRVYQLAARGP